jgi:hypothetical protein
MNRASLVGCLALMDLCWVMPWSVLVGLWLGQTPGRPLISAPAVLALVLLGATSTHALGRRVASSQAARLLLASLGVVAALAVVRFDQFPDASGFEWVGPLIGALAAVIGQASPAVLAFVLALYLWWRGVRLGSQTPSYVEVESAFRWGIGRLVVFGLLVALTARPSALSAVEAATTPYVIGFFFVSLVGLALGRLESLRTRTRNLSINTQWFGVLLLVAGLVVLVALLLAQLVSFDLLLVATRPVFNLVGQVLLLLVYVIVFPMAYIVQWIIYLFISLLRGNSSQQPPQPPQPADVDDALQHFVEQVPPELLFAVKAALAAILLGVVLLVVARTLSRWRPSSADADATNEERDSLWDARRARGLFINWLRRLLRRGRAAPVNSAATDANAVVLDHARQLSSVRALYARLLALGEATGAPRAAGTTPFEYLPALNSALEPEMPLTRLTEAYVRVRYAEDEEPADTESAALRDDLGRVRAKGAQD